MVDVMRDLLMQALLDIVGVCGDGAFSNSAQFNGNLGDVLGNRGIFAGEAKRLRNLLNIAINEMKAYTRLRDAFAKHEYHMVENLISEMDSNYDIKTETAGTVIRCVAELLNYPADRARAAADKQKIIVRATPNGGGYIYSKFMPKSRTNSKTEYVVELGRGFADISDILGYAPGAVLELDGHIGEQQSLVVNGKLIAKGEALSIGDKLYFRIARLYKHGAVNG